MIPKVITKFISELSDLGKILLAVASILIIIALFDRLLVSSIMSRLSELDSEISKEETTVKADMHFLSYKDKILKESKLIEPYLIKRLPTEDEITTSLLKNIEIMAAKANVTLVKTTPLAGVQQNDYLKYEADVDCFGKLTDVITFMHLINSSDELIKVTKFNLGSKKAETDEIKAAMTVAKIIVSQKPLVKPVDSSSGSPQVDTSTTKAN